jgi:thiol-disulfide isomerase/thioredoxin
VYPSKNATIFSFLDGLKKRNLAFVLRATYQCPGASYICSLKKQTIKTKKMKINALFATLTLVFAAFTLNAQQTIPDVTVKTLDGHIVNLQESYANNGKITILSFWATWCKPCQKELDAIADLYPDWQEMYDVEVVARRFGMFCLVGDGSLRSSTRPDSYRGS